jgi:hypothetical protein
VRRLILDSKETVVHIPLVLYFWRAIPGSAALALSEKPTALLASYLAVQMAVKEDPVMARVRPSTFLGSYLSGPKNWERSVSIVIPTALTAKDSAGNFSPLEENLLVHSCLKSIEISGIPEDIEIILVASKGVRIPKLLTELHNFRIVHDSDQSVNIARKMNIGASVSRGEALIFLNDDITLRSIGMIDEMLSYLNDDTVGTVAPLLLYPDERIQCAGVGLNPESLPAHISRFAYSKDAGYHEQQAGPHEVLCNTGAFLAITAKLFHQIGGFDEKFAVNYNDIDLGLRLLSLGYRNLIIPNLRAIHLESASRTTHADKFEEMTFLDRWGSVDFPNYYPNRFNPRAFDFSFFLDDSLRETLKLNLRAFTK